MLLFYILHIYTFLLSNAVAFSRSRNDAATTIHFILESFRAGFYFILGDTYGVV